MGRGGTNSLWSSGITCCCLHGQATNLEEVERLCSGFNRCDVCRRGKHRQTKLAVYSMRTVRCSQCYRDKPYGQLVSVSLTHYCASTPDLSTSWSRTTLQGAQGSGKSHLKASFPLRCFQRLSLPNIATRQCHWRDNRYTRGSSTPVLSY